MEGLTAAFDIENWATTLGSVSNPWGANGLRASKTTSGGTTYFLYDGSLPVCELSSTGSVTATNTFGGAGLISRHTSGGSTFYTFDAMGNVAQRYTSTGNLVSSDLYDAFGKGTSTGGGDVFGYEGHNAGSGATLRFRIKPGIMETMPALDRYHETVRHALTKDGWMITDDPLTLELDERTLFADFGAERLLAAERGMEKIAVEIKTFRNPSPVADLEQAIGQYSLYEDILHLLEAERMLYLAIPEEAFTQIFSERIGQLALKNRIKRAFVFNPSKEEIIQWLP